VGRGCTFRGAPEANPVRPGSDITLAELVQHLKEETSVLHLNVDDTQAAFALQPADERPGHLAVPSGAGGSAFLEHAAARLVNPGDRHLGELDGGGGASDLCHEHVIGESQLGMHRPTRTTSTSSAAVGSFLHEGQSKVALREGRDRAVQRLRQASRCHQHQLGWGECCFCGS
jgi:hypothetical protein